jgi:hypothetical protein
MKKYNVTIGIEYKHNGKWRQVACLNRDGKTIGTREFLDGVCHNEFVIDGISLEIKNYFVNEAKDLIKLSQKSNSEIWSSKLINA